MKKGIFASILAVLLAFAWSLGVFAATPVQTISGPLEIVSSNNEAYDKGRAYISHNNFQTFEKDLTIAYKINLHDLGAYGQMIITLDSWDSNDWGGYQIRIEGGDALYANSKSTLDSEMGISIQKAMSPGWEFVAGVAFDTMVDFDVDYRFVVQRCVGASDVTVNIYYFKDGTPVPNKPTLTYTSPVATYGDRSAGGKFMTWDVVNATITDYNLYDQLFSDVIPDYVAKVTPTEDKKEKVASSESNDISESTETSEPTVENKSEVKDDEEPIEAASSNTLLIILIVIAGILLLAVIGVVVYLILTRKKPQIPINTNKPDEIEEPKE